MATQPSLPSLLASKLYKTGQTRGADDDDIYQNRVGRNSTVLIPYEYWEIASHPPEDEHSFENGFIALISPQTFFRAQDIEEQLAKQGLRLGKNALVFYETRADWTSYHPDSRGWRPASRRLSPLGGEFVARVPATTARGSGQAIKLGFTTTESKGAGIRVYEYASTSIVSRCRLQLEALFWMCNDAGQVAADHGMSIEGIGKRREENARKCADSGLLDMSRLASMRLISEDARTMCPLCLEELSAEGFFTKVEQAEGRAVLDLTITKLNLFHVEELRIGQYGHRPYNLGWGHHHCNVVTKDAGIDNTLIWMKAVVDRNVRAHYIEEPKSNPLS